MKITQAKMNDIAMYMDDDIREAVHFKIAPCEPEVFLRAYVERDPSFKDLLKSEFNIEL